MYNQTTGIYENTTGCLIEKSKLVVPLYVLIITAISCCLSVLGAIVIFHSYYAIPSIRNYIRKLLLFLTIANLIDVLGIITGVVRNFLLAYTTIFHAKKKHLCVAQGIVTSYAPCSSFFWTVFIAIYFQAHMLRSSCADKLSGKWPNVVYHVCSWGVPAILCFAAISVGAFGETENIFIGPWCWIRTYKSKTFTMTWMFVTVKGLELLSYLVLAEVLVIVFFMNYILPVCLKRRQYINLDERGQLRKEDRNFLFVWLIFYILRVGGTSRFVMHAIHDPLKGAEDKIDMIMMTWQSFGDTAQAFANFICLCVCDKTIRTHYCRTPASGSVNNQATSENYAENRETFQPVELTESV